MRVYRGQVLDAYLNRDDAAKGYTIAIWRGRHVAEPTTSTDQAPTRTGGSYSTYAAGSSGFPTGQGQSADAGNRVPHLHTHIVPRYLTDPDPGQPPRFMMVDARWQRLSDEVYLAQIAALRDALST